MLISPRLITEKSWTLSNSNLKADNSKIEGNTGGKGTSIRNLREKSHYFESLNAINKIRSTRNKVNSRVGMKSEDFSRLEKIINTTNYPIK